MTVNGRDLSLLTSLYKFKQLTSAQLRQLHFATSASATSADRALKRLMDQKLITRIERRLVGGKGGGSGQFVYVLTAAGARMFSTDGRPIQISCNISWHALTIADTYIELLKAEREGLLTLSNFVTEPDCWAEVGGIRLRPDLFVELRNRSGALVKIWFEVDLGTEGQRQIKEKLAANWVAYKNADETEWPVFPYVLWLTVDEHRARELKWLIAQGTPESQQLFNVVTLDKLTGLFAQ